MLNQRDGLSKSFEWLEMKGRDEGVKMEVIQFQFWEWHLISSTNVVCRRLLTLVLPWCYLIISSSVIPFFSCLHPFKHEGLFQWVSSSHKVAKVLELQLQHQSFQWIFTVDFFYDWLAWSPCSPRDSQESSPTPAFKSINSSVYILPQ